MTIENGVRVIAGTLVLVSTLLAFFVSNWWLLLTGFIGANLIQSAFTCFCPATKVLKKLGFTQS